MSDSATDGDGTSANGASASATTLVSSGFAAGVAVTGFLNPYDRALFLSVAKKRPFLHHCNWRHPYQGLSQSIVGRAISTGLWFPLERASVDALRLHDATAALPPGVRAAIAGQIAGAVNALILSPLAFVKYQTWGLPEGKRSFQRTALKVVREAGPSAFFRGLPATVYRDCVFGGLFGWMRTTLRQAGGEPSPGGEFSPGVAHRFFSDTAAAGAATALSAPFNFARNMHFAQPISHRPMSTADALRVLWREAMAETSSAASINLIIRRLNVGWGTLRVAGGMGLTACFFDGFVWLGTTVQ